MEDNKKTNSAIEKTEKIANRTNEDITKLSESQAEENRLDKQNRQNLKNQQQIDKEKQKKRKFMLNLNKRQS